MNITTKYGLIWYSTSILGFWNSHWCSGSNDCLGYHVRIGCSIVVTLYGSNNHWKRRTQRHLLLCTSTQVARLNTLGRNMEKHLSRKKRVRKYVVWSIEGFKAQKHPPKVSYVKTAINPIKSPCLLVKSPFSYGFLKQLSKPATTRGWKYHSSSKLTWTTCSTPP